MAGQTSGGWAGVAVGALGALMASWTTFAPSFLWIFAGAPFVEDARALPRLAGALRGVTAAVVGVIAHVALWFALNVLFGAVNYARLGPLRFPTVDLAALDVAAAALSALAFLLMFRVRWGVMALVAMFAALGVAVESLAAG
jgi:chromate transporter